MPADLDYADEKYALGLYILATTEGSLRDRLRTAYAGQVVRASEPTDDVPEAIAEQIRDLDARLTSASARGDEGSIAATVAELSDDDAHAAATTLVDIALLLRDASAKRHPERRSD